MTDFWTITLDGSRALVRFVWRYAASARELWSALTERDRMRRWLGAAVSIESRVGGAARLRWDSGDEMRGEVTVLEPGRLLEDTWCEAARGVESVVRLESRAEPSGTLLVLEHAQVSAGQAAGFAAGWRDHLDAVAAMLAGRPLDPHERYRELGPEYASGTGSGSR